MKVLYYGGQKSGKSRLAERKALELAKGSKPYYIATYDNTYADTEMQERLEIHQAQRKEKFISIEEPIYLAKVLVKGTYLVDCLSMWILNTLDREMEELFNELESLVQKRDIDIIFVLNDVSSGVIPMDKESRKFVDRSGVIGQRVASFCDEVYDVKLGIGVRLK